MSTEEIKPGPRQTVRRCKHPTLGEGIAVFDNGPAYFQADSGEVVSMKQIGLGGVSSSPARSWIVAFGVDGSRTELETTGRARGDSHSRRWHPQHGDGWFVMLSISPERALAARFEPDGGRPFDLLIHSMAVGRPSARMARKKVKGKLSPMSVEEDEWITYGLASGEIIAFRRSPPPAEAPAVTAPASAQGELFA